MRYTLIQYRITLIIAETQLGITLDTFKIFTTFSSLKVCK